LRNEVRVTVHHGAQGEAVLETPAGSRQATDEIGVEQSAFDGGGEGGLVVDIDEESARLAIDG
jgi:hypothetical protein